MTRLLIVSFSPIARDPRVLKQARLAVEAGWDLCVIGYGSEGDAVPGQFVPLPAPVSGLDHKVRTAARQGPSILLGSMALPAYWTSENAQRALQAGAAFAPDIVHANDWMALPVAARLGVPFIYDSHEFATGEQEERLVWRLLFKPYIAAIERNTIGKAASVVTVSDGIAERLRTLYALPRLPIVIRNTPPFREIPWRPTGEIIEVLYQGAYNPDRGLEDLIDSVPLWPAGYRLTMRGIGAPLYIRELKARAAGLGLAEDRIVFVDPVLPAELVEAAARFDVGIHPIPPRTVQTEYCLPNKFFEYLMAGLCLCVSPAREMAAIVEARGLGSVMRDTTPAAIAEAVAGLSRERIDAAKRASIETARDLNWENEKHRLLDLYRSLA